jgi:hypothetical protein
MSTISELFSRDPLLLTKEEVSKEIVAYFRERRAQFNLGAQQAGSTKKISAKAQEIVKNVKVEIEL